MADHKRIAHDLGNLAYRLTLLAENLRSQIQDEARRDQAVALLADTAARLREAASSLGEEGSDA